MKFPIFRSLKTSSFSLLTLALFSMHSAADTYVLTNGKELKGTMISETATHYILKVEIAENVLSEKKVLISDVKEIIRADYSKAEAKRLKTLVPIADFTKIPEYDRIIYKEFTPFLKKYPKSAAFKEIKKISEALKEERRIINDGGFKIDGKVKTKEEINDNLYEIIASSELHYFNRLAKSRKYVSAMRQFEKLEAKYKYTKPFLNAVAIAEKLIPNFKSAVVKLEKTVEKETAIRDKALARMTDSERRRTQKLLDQEANSYMVKLKHAEEELKSKWLPLNKYHMEPIKTVLKNLDTEQERLANLSKEKFTDAGKLYRQVIQLTNAKDPEGAKVKLEEFSKLNPPEEYVLALQVELRRIKNAADKKRAKLEAAAKKKEADEAKARAEERNAERNKDNKKTPLQRLKERKKLLENPL